MRLILSVISLALLISLSSHSNTKNDAHYFTYASQQVYKYHPKRTDYVIIIDYSKSIHATRLFLFDMKIKEIILRSRVAHAFKSGITKPVHFSNKIGSNMTSKGNYLTLDTYFGKFGYSLRVKGLDPGTGLCNKLASIRTRNY